MGEKIGIYFALLGHYTTWLAPLSVLGLIMSIDQLCEWDLDAVFAPYFATFVSFWAVRFFFFLRFVGIVTVFFWFDLGAVVIVLSSCASEVRL